MNLLTTTIKHVVFLTSALLLTGNCLAFQVDNETLANQSTQLGQGLKELAKSNTTEYCAFDVNYSGNLLTSAGALIRGARYTNAEDSFEFVERTLARIKVNYADCPFYAAKMPFYYDKTFQLVRDLHSLVQANKTALANNVFNATK